MKNAKRSLAILLALCMTLSLLPATALATGDEDTAGVIAEEVIVEADKTDDTVQPEGDDADETGDEDAEAGDGDTLAEGDEDAAETGDDETLTEGDENAEGDDADQTEGDEPADEADKPAPLAEGDEPQAEEPAVKVAGEMTNEAFLAAADEDGVITLEGDVTLTACEPAVIDFAVTVELENCTLTIDGNGGFTVQNGGSLTIQNGNIEANSTEKTIKDGKELAAAQQAIIDVQAGSSVTLDAVTFNTSGVGVYPLGSAASVRVVDSTINAHTFAVATNAGSADNYDVVINLENSTFTGFSPVMINVPGTLNMKGCTVEGKLHGVIVRGGTAVIDGCKVNLDAAQGNENAFTSGYWGTGNQVTPAALTVGNRVASNSKDYQYPSNVTVTNGTELTASGEYAAVAAYSNADEDKGVTLNIGSDCTITGAMKMGNMVASVDGVMYPSVQKAIDAADGKTVVLCQDVAEESVTIAEGKTITLDLNGYTLKGFNTHTVTNKGTLTIIDSAFAAANGVEDKMGKIVGVNYGDLPYSALVNEGECTIASGMITRAPYLTEGAKQDNQHTNSNYTVQNKKAMYITGGLIVNNSTISSMVINLNNQGSDIYGQNEDVYMEISGGCLKTNTYTALKNDPNAKMVIKDGAEIINSESSSYVTQFYGYVTIEGGSFTGGQLWVCSHADAKGDYPTKVEITGGELDLAAVKVIYGYTMTEPKDAKAELAITGDATVNCSTWQELAFNRSTRKNDPIDDKTKAQVALSAGTYSTDVTAYCIDGYVAQKNADGKYTVVVDPGKAAAQVGDVQYLTLQDAIDAAKNGDTVTLCRDVVESVTVAGKNITLDLAGYKLADSEEARPGDPATGTDTITVACGATLTINGNNGTVDNVSHGRSAIYNSGTVVLNGGTYTRSAENGVQAKVSKTECNTYYTLLNHGDMTVNNATVKVETTNIWSSAMVANGYYSYTTSGNLNPRVNYVEGVNAAAPKLVINGGTFTGGHDLIKNDEGGVLEINDGTFTGLSTAGKVVQNWNEATITGGTFTAVGNVFYNNEYGNYGKGELTITGGTFTASAASGVFDSGKTYPGISGGTYSSDVSDYCVLGYKAEKNADGMYGIVEDTSKVEAKIVKDGVTTYYETLQEALDVAKTDAGVTVTLVKDITTTAVLNIDGSLTLDGAGYTITAEFAPNVSKRLAWVEVSNVEVTLKNIKFVSPTAERGIQVDPNQKNVTLNIENCEIPATHYAINISNGTKNVTLNISDSTITGWDALNIMGDGHKVTVKDSTLKGINSQATVGASNLFGVVVLMNSDGYIATNCDVELVDCTITAETLHGNVQCAVFFKGGTSGNTVKISGDKTVVTYPENSQLCLQNGTDNGLAVSAGTYSAAVPLEYCAEGFLPVAKGDAYSVAAGELTLTPSVTSRRGAGTVTLTVAPAGLTCEVKVTCNDETIAVNAGTTAGTYTVSLPNQNATYTFTAALVEDETVTADCTVAVTRSSGSSSGSSSSGSGSSNTGTDTPVVELGDIDVPLADKPFLFVDVTQDDWFYDAVKFVYNEELMRGESDILFAPEDNTTRGMVATILHRMESEPEATVTADFVDVVPGSWYAAAMEWAAEVELVKGTSQSVKTAAPEVNITREQLVTILYRYAVMKGMDVTARADLSGFVDEAEVGAYAREAMEWAVSVGLIQGRGANRLAPLGETTRSELATILTRFKALPVPEAEGED